MHSRYVCAHAGACCRAAWPIPVEEELIAPLRAFGFDVGADRLAPKRPDGQCVFFEAGNGRLCAIHRSAGPSLLPSVCRHFPRVIVNDPRGASVTLSHFCPTAARLLLDDEPLAIVEAPVSVSLDGTLEGLDATGVLPPLLAPGILMDWEGYSAWEAEAVALFDEKGLAPEQAVGRLALATEAACSWRPGRGPLAAAVRRAFSDTAVEDSCQQHNWGSFRPVVNRFLAAHAFASWAPYAPDGLRAVPRTVADALALLTAALRQSEGVGLHSLVQAIRETDWRLRHQEAAVR